MNMVDWVFVSFIAFLGGIGNKCAGELIDYLKKKRHRIKEFVLAASFIKP